MRQELLYNDCLHFSPRGKELLLLKWSPCNMTVGNNVSWVKWVYGKLAIYRQYRGAIYILLRYPMYFFKRNIWHIAKVIRKKIIIYLLIIKCLKKYQNKPCFCIRIFVFCYLLWRSQRLGLSFVSRKTETMQSYPHTANPPWVTQMYNSTIILWSTHDNITVY